MVRPEHPPPSRPDTGTHRPEPESTGLYTILGRAFVTPVLAWPRFCYPTSRVALRFAPLKRCARASVVRPSLSPVGRAQHLCNTTLYNFPLRARRTGFSHT